MSTIFDRNASRGHCTVEQPKEAARRSPGRRDHHPQTARGAEEALWAEVPVCREAGLARRGFGRQPDSVKDREGHVGE